MPENTGKYLATAMESLAKLGKYYKRHGHLPQFTTIQSPQAKKLLHKTIERPGMMCGTCGLLFLGPLSARCQCPVQTKYGQGMNKGRHVEVA